jgi:hypothetical protein
MLVTPALPRVPHPRHDRSGLTASETASSNGCPQGAAGPAKTGGKMHGVIKDEILTFNVVVDISCDL